jgi:DcuC family C4-dicarboxylate transporter
VSRRTAGALLLLGGSMGGELLNPAAVEVAAIKLITKAESHDIVKAIMPYNLIGAGTALLVFWLMSFRWQRCDATAVASPPSDKCDAAEASRPGTLASLMTADVEPLPRINAFKACVPLVPILLLMLVKPNIPLPASLRWSETNKLAEQACIAAAMLTGVVAASALSPKKITTIPGAFFDGAAFAFAYVIPVITGATMFAEGVKLNGLIERMTSALHGAPAVVVIAAFVLAWLMAMVTGTAVGTAPLVINMMLPLSLAAGPAGAATRTGAVAAVGAQFGRRCSPVAAVVIRCAALAKDSPLALVRRVLVPLLAGGAAVLIAASLRR